MDLRKIKGQGRILMKLGRALLVFAGLQGAICAQALTSTTVLPTGIDSPSFRMGTIQGIDQKYVADGSLMKLGDYKSVAFDAPQLAKFSPDAKKLIDVLNRFGPQSLGDKFNLGVLRVDTSPQVKYFAPVYARGVTERWTLGLGMPIVNYTNKIRLSQQFSNIDYYRQQFSGLDPELDAALNTNLGQATNQTLIGKGYRPLVDRDETFLGDVQLVSLYRLYEDPNQALVYQSQLGLPTGPKYNTDDLAAINIFGRTTLNNTLAYSRKLGTRFTVVPYLAYLVNFQDSVDVRVPGSEDDALPDASTKENLQRKIGNTATLGGNLVYDASDALGLGVGYEMSEKDQDVYRGGRNQRYDLLALNTANKARRASLEITYSSVKSYFKKAAILPAMITYGVSDVIAGVNIERQLIQELNLMLFF
jgi:hypothetical protein